MRISAVLISTPPNRWMGAELATHALLRRAQRAGHEVRVLSAQPPQAADYRGVPLAELGDGSALDGDDGVILTHAYQSAPLLAPMHRARGRYGTPIVFYAHSSRPEAVRAAGALHPDLVVANSAATARGLPAAHGMPVVSRPLLDPPNGAPGAAMLARGLLHDVLEGEGLPMVGAVNGSQLKGGHLLEFLLRSGYPAGGYALVGVPGGYGDLEEYPRLAARMIARQLTAQEMRAFYRSLGVFLQPSFSESWGMSALEALCAGVPVVASRTPGASEALAGFGPQWVRWLDPMSTEAPQVLDGAIRELLDGRRTAEDERERERELQRLAAGAEQEADTLIHRLAAAAATARRGRRGGGGRPPAHVRG